MAFKPVGFLLVLMSFLGAGIAAFAASTVSRTSMASNNASISSSNKKIKRKAQDTSQNRAKSMKAQAYQAPAPSTQNSVYVTSIPVVMTKATSAPSTLVAANPATMMSSVSVTPTPTTSSSAPSASGFHFLAGLTGSSNMYDQSSPDHQASTELLLNPSYSFNENYSLSLKSLINHQETKARDTELSNTTVALKRKGPEYSTSITSSGQIFGVLPTDEISRKNDRLQTAAGLGAAVKWTWKKLGVTYSFQGTRNIHEYTVSADGTPNIQYGLTQALAADLELTSQWSISAAGAYKQGWTYENFARQVYSFDADINYSLNKLWTLNAGFSNEGNALKANGTGSNIKVYDENTSVVRVGVTFVN